MLRRTRRRRHELAARIRILFQIGPSDHAGVVTTWVIMLVLVLGGYLLTRRIGTVAPRRAPGRA
jgi:hypothetical protein